MKALILHGPGDYEVQNDWLDPVVKIGWARVHVTYAGICGSDLHMLKHADTGRAIGVKRIQ